MSTKYIIHKDSGKVLFMTKDENFEMDDHMTMIDDPPIAEGTDIDKEHLIYKDGAIYECTREDLVRCAEIAIECKKKKAIENAEKFMELTGDTMVSATALMKALHKQMRKLEAKRPVDDFDVVISDYTKAIENWEEKISKRIRFC